jgi:hypothetical protein
MQIFFSISFLLFFFLHLDEFSKAALLSLRDRINLKKASGAMP